MFSLQAIQQRKPKAHREKNIQDTSTRNFMNASYFTKRKPLLRSILKAVSNPGKLIKEEIKLFFDSGRRNTDFSFVSTCYGTFDFICLVEIYVNESY